jgi:hypothetical protein
MEWVALNQQMVMHFSVEMGMGVMNFVPYMNKSC